MLEGFRRVFLGPSASFRNAHRTWLYFGFIALVVVLLLWRTLAAP